MSYNQLMGALCLWREARGLPDEALIAIWWVLFNRITDAKKRWPRTIAGVVTQHAQFSSFSQNDTNCVKYPQDDGSPDWNAWLRCLQVVMTTAMANDPTGGANHYENCNPDQLPLWADASKLTLTIGTLRFYKL